MKSQSELLGEPGRSGAAQATAAAKEANRSPGLPRGHIRGVAYTAGGEDLDAV